MLSLPLLFLTTALRIEMNSLGLYIRGFDTYSVAETTLLSETQLHDAAEQLIRYFNHLEPSPQMTVVDNTGRQFNLYHDYEIIHLEDVRDLFDINSIIQSLTLLIVAGFAIAGVTLGYRMEILTAMRNGSLAALTLLLLTSTAFLADFDWMFVGFHLVAFDNPFWQLNPYTDYLVMLFPLGFWQDMMILAGAAVGVMAGAIFTLSHASIRRDHRRNL